MIRFIFKAILRDKNRSLLPVIVVAIGVFLTISISGYIGGAIGDMIDQTARFETGHLKIMSKAYAENKDQIPNDLALLGVDELTQNLKEEYPDHSWVKRIRFGGLIDVPDEQGDSRGQGPAFGLAIEIFSEDSKEIERMNIRHSIVEGRIPKNSREALIGHEFAQKLNLNVGDEITYMGSTMNGAMTFESFVISGTIRFGIPALDKGMVIIDLADARRMLDMEDAAGEILGFYKDEIYIDEKASIIAANFNEKYAESEDEFTPVMLALREQNNMGSYLGLVDAFASMFVVIFVIIMSVVLWNTGLIGGLRRYQEFGIRLALGENKGHIYRTLFYEAVLVGIIGSVVGTAFGLGLTFYLQVHGIDISGMMTDATMIMPSVLRSKFTPQLLYIGFIPGVFAMVIGNLLSGLAIYKRQTATLIKELEV